MGYDDPAVFVLISTSGPLDDSVTADSENHIN